MVAQKEEMLCNSSGTHASRSWQQIPRRKILGEKCSWEKDPGRKRFLGEKCSWEKDPRRKRFLGERS